MIKFNNKIIFVSINLKKIFKNTKNSDYFQKLPNIKIINNNISKYVFKTNDYADIIEILVTAHNEEKRTFSCGKISSFWVGMGGRKVDLFVALCKKPRDTSFAVDERLGREVVFIKLIS